MAVHRFDADNFRTSPESLVDAAKKAYAAAVKPGDADCERALAYVARAERGLTSARVPVDRVVAIGHACRSVREAVARFEATGSKGEIRAHVSPPRGASVVRSVSSSSVLAPRKDEGPPVKITLPRLPAPIALAKEEYEEKVEDVCAELLSAGSPLRGALLRVEARKLLGQAGYRLQ